MPNTFNSSLSGIVSQSYRELTFSTIVGLCSVSCRPSGFRHVCCMCAHQANARSRVPFLRGLDQHASEVITPPSHRGGGLRLGQSTLVQKRGSSIMMDPLGQQFRSRLPLRWPCGMAQFDLEMPNFWPSLKARSMRSYIADFPQEHSRRCGRSTNSCSASELFKTSEHGKRSSASVRLMSDETDRSAVWQRLHGSPFNG